MQYKSQITDFLMLVSIVTASILKCVQTMQIQDST